MKKDHNLVRNSQAFKNLASAAENLADLFIHTTRTNASGLWSIASWTDIATNPEYCWTELKAEFIRG